LISGVIGDQEGAAETRILEPPGVAVGPRLREFAGPGPCRQLVADQRVERLDRADARARVRVRSANASFVCTTCSWLSGDDDQIQNRD
jgi:hypothetical protein